MKYNPNLFQTSDELLAHFLRAAEGDELPPDAIGHFYIFKRTEKIMTAVKHYQILKLITGKEEIF